MWRSIIIALGIMAIVVGLECLVIDSAAFYSGNKTAASFFNPAGPPAPGTKVWTPREWLPWALLTVGTITILYAFTLPKRWRRDPVV